MATKAKKTTSAKSSPQKAVGKKEPTPKTSGREYGRTPKGPPQRNDDTTEF